MKSDQLKTSIHKWNELNLDELADFTVKAKQATPQTFQHERNIEQERRIIDWRMRFSPAFVVITRKGSEILGWLSFDIESNTIVEVGRWLPVVIPCVYEDEIVYSLIKKCKKYCRETNYPRVEVSFELSDNQDEQAYSTLYKRWYEVNDVFLKDEIIYMKYTLSEKDKIDVNFPKTLMIERIRDIDPKEFYRCYYEAFIKGKDRMFLDQTKTERQAYFNDYYSRSKPYIDEASLVVRNVNNHEIIGVSLIRPRGEDAHLALITIHPNYQGRNFGKLLLKKITNQVSQLGFKTISLGVDTENEPALKLYQNIGFEEASRIITHCWKRN